MDTYKYIIYKYIYIYQYHMDTTVPFFALYTSFYHFNTFQPWQGSSSLLATNEESGSHQSGR